MTFAQGIDSKNGIHVFPINCVLTENVAEREKCPIAGRNPGICMINGNGAVEGFRGSYLEEF